MDQAKDEVVPPSYMGAPTFSKAQTTQAFRNLKVHFNIWYQPNPSLSFIFEVDASENQARAGSSQNHGNLAKIHPSVLFSIKLTQAEQNYDMGNHELQAIKEP